MPDLTPALPPRYRRLALTALMGLTARAKRAVASHRTAVEQLRTSGEESTLAQARLNLAERGLALLRGRQQFMQSDHQPPTDD